MVRVEWGRERQKEDACRGKGSNDNSEGGDRAKLIEQNRVEGLSGDT